MTSRNDDTGDPTPGRARQRVADLLVGFTDWHPLGTAGDAWAVRFRGDDSWALWRRVTLQTPAGKPDREWCERFADDLDSADAVRRVFSAEQAQ